MVQGRACGDTAKGLVYERLLLAEEDEERPDGDGGEPCSLRHNI